MLKTSEQQQLVTLWRKIFRDFLTCLGFCANFIVRKSSGQGAIPDRWYSPRAVRQIRLDSEADSIVWMEEDKSACLRAFYLYSHRPELISGRFLFRSQFIGGAAERWSGRAAERRNGGAAE